MKKGVCTRLLGCFGVSTMGNLIRRDETIKEEEKGEENLKQPSVELGFGCPLSC